MPTSQKKVHINKLTTCILVVAMYLAWGLWMSKRDAEKPKEIQAALEAKRIGQAAEDREAKDVNEKLEINYRQQKEEEQALMYQKPTSTDGQDGSSQDEVKSGGAEDVVNGRTSTDI